MGGQSSRTRKLTLENDEANVIKVSDEVVTRLRGANEVRKRQAAAQQQPEYPAVATPPPFYHYEPSLTSLQIRQEAAENLKKNDEYWAKRINDLERSHQKMKILMEEELRKAKGDMQLQKNKDVSSSDVPCVTNRKNVIACYKKYPYEPMRCAKEVQAFAQCVDAKRIHAVENVRQPVKA